MNRTIVLTLAASLFLTVSRAAEYIVTNTADAGQGSLRWAIEQSNANPGRDDIYFSIAGAGPHVIRPMSRYPAILDPVTIDGYSRQAGASMNTSAGGNNAVIPVAISGEHIPDQSGLEIYAGNSIVRGLAIFGFTQGIGLLLAENDDNLVTGNLIGTTSDIPAQRNKTGIHLDMSDSNTIGGAFPEDQNRIIRNTGSGMVMLYSSGNAILGNEVGRNWVHGIYIVEGSGNEIGNGDPSGSNRIYFNGVNGVFIRAESTIGNRISVNSIDRNGKLGIDLFKEPGPENPSLKTDGVTENDYPGDVDTGPNMLLNYPILKRVTIEDSSHVRIEGNIWAEPNTTYRIEVYSNDLPDPSKHGEGQHLAGAFNVTTDDKGYGPFDLLITRTQGLFYSSTCTDPDRNTSEFSTTVPLRAATVFVTTNEPEGPGSIAEAVTQANTMDTSEGYVIIEFNLPVFEIPDIELIETINITNDRVYIRGIGDPLDDVESPSTGKIEKPGVNFNGSASSSGIGFRWEGNDGILEGVGFNQFDDAALEVAGDRNTIRGNWFGGNYSSSPTWGNGVGLRITDAGENLVGGTSPETSNRFSGNRDAGLILTGTETMDNSILGNRIEETTAGPALLSVGATYNLIGDADPGGANVFRYNNGPGVREEPGSMNITIGNRIMWNEGLPVDLGTPGATPNDVPDSDGIPNFPEVGSAIISPNGQSLHLSGSLNTQPGTVQVVNIQVYRVSSDEPSDGGRFVGMAELITESDGSTSFELDVEIENLSLFERDQLRFVTQTGGFSTSEYSPAISAFKEWSDPGSFAIQAFPEKVSLSFESNLGSSYDIIRSSTLQPDSWNPVVVNIPGSGEVVTIDDPVAPDMSWFYQLEESRGAYGGLDNFQTIALTGESAPNSAGPYEAFISPTINGPGQVAFLANTGTHDNIFLTPIWELFLREPNGGIHTLLKADRSETKGSFQTINQVTLDRTAPFSISDSGVVAGTAQFFVTESAGILTKFTASVGYLDKVLTDGAEIPMVPADNDSQMLYWEQGGQFSMPVRLNDRGDMVFGAAYRRENNFSFAGSGIHNASGLVVRNGYSIPGYEAETYRGVGGPVINDRGRVAFTGARSGGDRYTDGLLVVQNANSLGVWLAEYDIAPGYPVSETKETRFTHAAVGGVPFVNPQFNASGQIAFGAALGDVDPIPGSGSPTVYSQFLLGEGNEGIYVGAPPGIPVRVVAQEQSADQFDSPSSYINALSSPVLSESGMIAYTATYGPDHVYVSGKGLFVYDSMTGNTRRVYMTGDTLNALPAFGPTGLFLSINEVRLDDDHERIAVNDIGEVAFLAELGPDNRIGLFFADANGILTVLALEGSEFVIPSTGQSRTVQLEGGIQFQGGSNSSGLPVGFNNRGQVVFGLKFDDNSAGTFMYTPPIGGN